MCTYEKYIFILYFSLLFFPLLFMWWKTQLCVGMAGEEFRRDGWNILEIPDWIISKLPACMLLCRPCAFFFFFFAFGLHSVHYGGYATGHQQCQRATTAHLDCVLAHDDLHYNLGNFSAMRWQTHPWEWICDSLMLRGGLILWTPWSHLVFYFFFKVYILNHTCGHMIS